MPTYLGIFSLLVNLGKVEPALCLFVNAKGYAVQCVSYFVCCHSNHRKKGPKIPGLPGSRKRSKKVGGADEESGKPDLEAMFG